MFLSAMWKHKHEARNMHMSLDYLNIYTEEFLKYKLIYDNKIHDMHIYGYCNLSSKCNKNDFVASQRGRRRRWRQRER